MISLDTYIVDAYSPTGVKKAGDYMHGGSMDIIVGLTFDIEGRDAYITGFSPYRTDDLGISELITVVVEERDGYPITATLDQEIAVVVDGVVVWRKLIDLQDGDLICAPVITPYVTTGKILPLKKKQKSSVQNVLYGIPLVGRLTFTKRVYSFASPGGFLRP